MNYGGAIGCGICLILLRPISAFFVLSATVRWILRKDNSNTYIRKLKKSATGKERFTYMCYWNAESSEIPLLRFFISLRLYGIITWLFPLIGALVFYNIGRGDLGELGIYVGYAYDLFVQLPVAMFTMSLRPDRKHKK